MGILDGRVAIVTGASSGVGYGCALRIAEEGAKVITCARRADRLKELCDEIRSRGGAALAVTCDVTKKADIANAVSTTVDRYGRIDILANIAQGGIADQTYLADVTPESALASYIAGPLQSLLFMQHCFPYMKAQSYGRIINTGAHAAITGSPGASPYGMSKGAIMALTRAASQEWAEFGIVTNTILPVVRTDPYDWSPQARRAATVLAERIPVRRFGTPYEDCAPIVAFLASEAAGYLNGQVIPIDGGLRTIA